MTNPRFYGAYLYKIRTKLTVVIGKKYFILRNNSRLGKCFRMCTTNLFKTKLFKTILNAIPYVTDTHLIVANNILFSFEKL